MQKEQRKTDFWINTKAQKNKSGPGKYDIPMLNARKDHYHGTASFGRSEGRFDK